MFVQPTAIEVASVYYWELYNIMWKHDCEKDFDWEDWLIERTHFIWCPRGKQWEAHTLDLISQMGGPEEVG